MKTQNSKLKTQNCGVDVLLIMPPNNFTDMVKPKSAGARGYYMHYPHLGIAYLAAVLERDGFKVDLLDGVAEGFSEEDVVQYVKAHYPRIVGITVTAPTVRVAYRLSRAIKNSVSTTLVLGGPHISYHPETISYMGVDFGFRGESEYGLLEMCRALRAGRAPEKTVEGLVWMENEIVKQNGAPIIKALDELPFPARHLLDNRAYRNPVCSAVTTSMVSIRGCPYDCLFCSRAVRGRATHELSVKRTVEEMKECVEKHGIEYITFMDETFTEDKRRTEALCEKILSENVKVKWACQTRADLVTPQLLKLMGEAGCMNLSCGIEAATPELRKVLKKPVAGEHYRSLIQWCRDAGITTNAYFIFGHPGETLENMKQTIYLATHLGLDHASFNITNIFPGSPLYAQMVAEGKLAPDIWEGYAKGEMEVPVFVPEGLSKELLEKMLKKAFFAFYFRPGYMLEKFIKLKSLRDMMHHLRAALVILKDFVLMRTRARMTERLLSHG